MLERYIIGRIVEPWVNIESPMRLSRIDGGSINAQHGSKIGSACKRLQPRSCNDGRTKHRQLHRVQLAVEAEEQEQQACLKHNLPLDARTQQAVAQDYRALHEQIKQPGSTRAATRRMLPRASAAASCSAALSTCSAAGGTQCQACSSACSG